MDIHFSPSQEQRMHSILDKGMEALRESFEQSDLQSSSDRVRDSPPTKKREDLAELQAQISRLEGMLDQRTSRSSSKASNRTNSSKTLREVENLEREIQALERTPKRTNLDLSRQVEKVRAELDKQRKITEKLESQNKNLKMNIKRSSEMKEKILELQQAYNDITVSFERSEVVRKKQKVLIDKLKNELLGASTTKKYKKK